MFSLLTGRVRSTGSGNDVTCCRCLQDVYGLPEAVTEIKELKQQITVRDRTIEELTRLVNKCEEKINDLYDEADSLRDKLGYAPLEPIDLTEYRMKKGIRMQEDRALNRILQKEVRCRCCVRSDSIIMFALV